MQDINQFEQSVVLGQVDLTLSPNTIPGEISAAEAADLVSGSWVKMADEEGGVPVFAKCTADTDEAYGVICYNAKDIKRVAGESVEVASADNVVYLRATGAIARGAQVAMDTSEEGGVTATLTGVTIVGHAIDKAAADGDLIRVKLSTPSFAVGS